MSALARNRVIAIGGGILLLIVMTLLMPGFLPFTGKPKADAAACNVQTVAQQTLLAAGFKKNEFTVGKVDLSKSEATENGGGSFSNKPSTSSAQLVAFYKDSGKPNRLALVAAEKATGMTAQQVQDPKNWVPFQLHVPSTWSGNTVFQNGKMVGYVRNSQSGDAGWVLVNSSDCAKSVKHVRTAVVRLGCTNPQTKVPTPVRPTPKPTSPPQSTPPTSPPHTTPPSTPPTTPPGKPKCTPPTVPYEGRCIKAPNEHDPGQSGGNGSPMKQPVAEHPQGPTTNAPSEPPKPNPGPKPTAGSPAPSPTPGGYDSGNGDGSTTPGGSTCDKTGCTGGGATAPSPGPTPTVDSGTHTADPGGF